MKHPFDDQRWASGREAIEREKNAARAWLAERDGNAAELVRKTAPASRRSVKPIRLAAGAATGIAVLYLGFLLLRPVFHSRSADVFHSGESIRAVFARIQSESGPSSELPEFLDGTLTSEAALSIQRVLCAVALEDSFDNGIPGLIRNALEVLRREGESPTNETIRKDPRRSILSETLLRIFQSIKEG